MAITLIVEDGTIVTGANTFASVATAREYATSRGVTLNPSNDVVAAELLNAMDYFLLYGDKWRGYPTSDGQTLPFPREWIDYVGPNGEPGYLDKNTVPANVIAAQVQLVMAMESGVVSLLPNKDAGLPVIKEKVGPLETEYAAPVSLGAYNWNSVSLPVVDLLLRPYINGRFHVRTVRI